MKKQDIAVGVEYAAKRGRSSYSARRVKLLAVCGQHDYGVTAKQFGGGVWHNWHNANGDVYVCAILNGNSGVEVTDQDGRKKLMTVSSRHIVHLWEQQRAQDKERMRIAEEGKAKRLLQTQQREEPLHMLRESIGVGDNFGAAFGSRCIKLTWEEVKTLNAAIAEIEWGNNGEDE